MNSSAWPGPQFTAEEFEILEVIRPTPSSLSSSSPEAKRRHASKLASQRTQRHRKKQQDELVYLKRKVDELQGQLTQLTLTQAMFPPEPDSKWKKLAKDERKRQADVLHENKRLKTAIEEQVHFAECLVEILKRRPTLDDTAQDQQWKLLKLVAEPRARHAAYHALVDHEYAKMDSVFIEVGIIDFAHGDHRRAMPQLLANGNIEIEEIVIGRFAVPLSIVAEAAWAVLRGAVQVSAFPGHYTVLEHIDASTAYTNSYCLHELGNSQSRTVVKKYMESPSRCVFVCRSVMEDELLPLDPAYVTCNEVSWLAFDVDESGAALGRFVQKAWLRPGELVAGGVVPDYLMNAYTEGTRSLEEAIKMQIDKLMGMQCEPWTV
ncbi:hypothetical protein SDRG_06523 [Saprolegnia diclina VS20]|uniref:START domain-containing protein n=1 Tax=Saprolegnia diclina (strain VS20) TaxID=1156394 RepID=T0QCY9_SAPDV|nr:hypothetical protein SDRG_06523 [Saprolegnia diclina VS20]EQC35764.1 hypothetical protein SDRG_06523 [Saprolegnia diclina VS20]|eukprot:XP_008610526.1 hypothetical protein SDRG_06523 [Saprolegnia diclina VS20]